MRLRRLNDAGVVSWRDILANPTDADFDQRRSELVEDPNQTQPLTGEVLFSPENLQNRLAIAKHLDSVIQDSGVADPELDAGLWSWLSLAGFEQLCAKDRDGQWKPGQWYRWVFQPRDYKVYYRHLLAGPCLIFRAHRDDPERAAVVLCGSVQNPGEAVEQLASSQAFVTSKGVMGAASDLYFDKTSGTLKRGAGGKGPGAARRMAAFLNQLDLTWDLFTLSRDEILGLAPSEFDRFR